MSHMLLLISSRIISIEVSIIIITTGTITTTTSTVIIIGDLQASMRLTWKDTQERNIGEEFSHPAYIR